VSTHRPVLLDEALAARAAGEAEEGWYVDATYGRGGHAGALLARLGPAGRLLALDRDPEAVRHGEQTLGRDPRVVVRHGNFEALAMHVRAVTGEAPVRGVLMDLGVSSPQLDDASRGFSFRADGALDMRMDPSRGASAAQWLARADEAELARVLRRYGEERHARRLARAIVAARARAPITSTAQLAAIVEQAKPRGRGPHIHPATRAFQAIRIHINRELEALTSGLEQAVEVLAPGGRLCVISFHSLEDRPVKRFMRRLSQPDPVYAGLPEMPDWARPRLRRIARAVHPDPAECALNPRARSAVMRVAEKL